MIMKTSTLRPGLLVSLKTVVTGNVRYQRNVIEAEHVTDEGTQQAKWETERTIVDPVEHEASRVARGKARTAITRVCAHSAFGLLCPEANATDLEEAIAEARGIADAFNANAKLTRVNVYVMTGRIAPDDVEAVRAINSEVRELLQDMENGVANLEVAQIREAASKARSIGTMLSDSAAERIKEAIKSARAVATKIVAAGEQAAIEVDKQVINQLVAARTAFLDLDEAGEVAAPATPGVALDLAPTSPVKTAPAQASAFEME